MIIQGDVRDKLKELEDESVHCVITSPPYWGLRDYGVEGQLGLEPTPEEHIEEMVKIFREVRRVLRDDGTLFLNYGDTFYDKQLVGMPWRLALALQADGWYLRSDIIWHKPNPMPESVRDRPTKAHEYLFLLTKSSRYYYDQEAIREPHTEIDRRGYGGIVYNGKHQEFFGKDKNSGRHYLGQYPSGRNKRTVWTIPTSPYKEAHFAVFPPALVEPCLLAGCPEKVCSKCGSPWERVIDTPKPPKEVYTNNNRPDDIKSVSHPESGKVGFGQKFQNWRDNNPSVFKGFQPSCHCQSDTIPGTVLDPFFGSGTVGQVAIKHNRHYIGIELNEEYIKLAKKRINKLTREDEVIDEFGHVQTTMFGGLK